MSAKQLLPDQCYEVLHPIYGAADCCLCKANQRIAELEAKIRELEGESEGRLTTVMNHVHISMLDIKTGKQVCIVCGCEMPQTFTYIPWPVEDNFISDLQLPK